MHRYCFDIRIYAFFSFLVRASRTSYNIIEQATLPYAYVTDVTGPAPLRAPQTMGCVGMGYPGGNTPNIKFQVNQTIPFP